MNDWLRSITLLGMAFAAVVVVTLALAGAIVPAVADETSGGASPSGTAAASASVAAHRPGAVGGSLRVSGDRDGAFVLDREITQDRYGLAGDDGRIVFEPGDPVTVGQVQYDGLEFFVDPEDCTVMPGERHEASGVAPAEIRCEALADVRDNGTISIEGTVGVAADVFGLRGDLPETGGTIELGDETLTVPAAGLVLAQFPGAYVGQLMADDHGAAVSLGYAPETHELSVVEIVYDGDVVPVGNECAVTETQIGSLNPHTRVSELRLECASVEIPALGSVPVHGTVIVDIAEPPR